MVHQFYVQLSKEVPGGGGGEVRGAFEQVLTAYIVTQFYFIGLRPSLSKGFIFPSPFSPFS